MVVVIPTANDRNLQTCTKSIFDMEKKQTPTIFVVDDGESKIDGLWFKVQGKKPFIFSRNVNVGMKIALAYDQNLIIMCDDVTLLTPNGFSVLEEKSEGFAVISPSVDGEIGNDNQRDHGRNGVAPENKELCFMCVLIKKETIQTVGFMDERFVGYGYEDIDYSRRVLRAGLRLGIMDSVKVSHKNYSVFRNRPDFGSLAEQNRKIYLEKWGEL